MATYTETDAGLLVPDDVMAISESLASLESYAALELALEDWGWTRLGIQGTHEFTREGLRRITQLARIMYLKNPLIQRGVNVQTYYVYGQGMNVSAEDEGVNEILQEFLGDAKNQAELTTHEARIEKERDLQVEANLFFCFFTNVTTGRVRVRSIPFDEITEVITSPDDAREPWYYKREWVQEGFDVSSGRTTTEPQVVYYPDWRHRPAPRDRPKTIGRHPVAWDTPVYHVRTGGLSRMRFGVSEVYAAIDWARAYKEFLENWSTIVKAYSRFAWRAAGMSTQSAVDAMKERLGATTSAGARANTNPPPVVASTLLEPGSVRMEPVRTAGATTSASDGRHLKLMVAMVFGLPETFFGDTSVGNLATAKTLDRPTELKMLSRQTLWANIHRNIIDYVLAAAVRAGRLSGSATEEDDGTPRLELAAGDPGIRIAFPPVLEHETEAAVNAIVKAATLGGTELAGTIELPLVARMLLDALGEQDVDEVIERQFPAGESVAETRLVQVARQLKEAVLELREGHGD